MLDSTERLIKFGSTALIDRERVLAQSDELRKSSLDYYAAVRSLYLQDRAVELQRDGPGAEARATPWWSLDNVAPVQGAEGTAGGDLGDTLG